MLEFSKNQYTEKQEKEFNQYLRKYQKQYKVFKNEDGVHELKTKFGAICPFDLQNNLLFYSNFVTSSKKTHFLNKIPTDFKIIQNSETEVCVRFPEKLLVENEILLKIKKRKVLSEETLNKLRLNIQKISNRTILS